MIHLFMHHAVAIGWGNEDLTNGVRKVRRNSVGFLAWEEEHIATFIKKHPHGTRAHLALSLLLLTGLRHSDGVRMGRQHIKDGWLSITQQKTGQLVTIPVHAQLAEIIGALPLTT